MTEFTYTISYYGFCPKCGQFHVVNGAKWDHVPTYEEACTVKSFKLCPDADNVAPQGTNRE